MLALLALLTLSATAATTEHQLQWELRVGGQRVGTRNATVKLIPVEGDVQRIIETWTELNGTLGPMDVHYKQRMTIFGERDPSSFHAVMDENGEPREVQARWGPAGWTVTVADRRRSRTFDAPIQRIDLSTADLLDPLSRVPLAHFDFARVLSAETGDVWEGAVQKLGPSTLEIAGKRIPVTGVAWTSPEGRSAFYYSNEGYLVQYQMRLYGFVIEGTLTSPPPPGLDDFPLGVGTGRVDEAEL